MDNTDEQEQKQDIDDEESLAQEDSDIEEIDEIDDDLEVEDDGDEEELDIEEDEEDEDDDEENNSIKNNIISNELGDNELEGDEDEGEDECGLISRFNEQFRKNYIERCHPELNHKTYHDMYELSKITKNERNIITDSRHRTIPILTKYEKAKIIGLRVTQLNNGAKPFISLKTPIIDNSLIAEKELKEKKIPFIIMRPIPNAEPEYWKLEDLEYIES